MTQSSALAHGATAKYKSPADRERENGNDEGRHRLKNQIRASARTATATKPKPNAMAPPATRFAAAFSTCWVVPSDQGGDVASVVSLFVLTGDHGVKAIPESCFGPWFFRGFSCQRVGVENT